MLLAGEAHGSPDRSDEDAIRVQANYKLTVSDGPGTWSIVSRGRTVDGEPILQDLGPYRVSLVPSLAGDGRYELEVAVGKLSSAATAVFAPSPQRYVAQLGGGPLEFRWEQMPLTVSGAVVVSVLD